MKRELAQQTYYTLRNKDGGTIQLRGDLTIEDMIRMGWTDFRLVKPNTPLKQNAWRAEEKDNAAHELLIQQVSDKKGVKWACLCGVNPREKEGDLLCKDCWSEIPPAKREGLARLKASDEDIVEYTMAAEQILRIAAKNLEAKKPTP